ncbi:protein CpxP [Bryocella elongata]|uniref:Protein CpxP n=1 Tax=Bryocella elongata TaxID=863522 RepID=A0A1H6BZQ9_9BACT|nr:Spy/CpxP family protein refolding chaperone [Bryocella elongata]SEG66194.1 protein CpxP [Bryocella elongata]
MNRTAITIACAGAVVATAVFAAGAQEPGARAQEFVLRRMEHRLGLTDGQREQIRGIVKTEQPVIVDLARRVHALNEELQGQPGFDEAQVRAFAKAHESTAEDVLVEREKIRTEVLQVLTPEQREKLQEMRAERVSQLVDRLSALQNQF